MKAARLMVASAFHRPGSRRPAMGPLRPCSLTQRSPFPARLIYAVLVLRTYTLYTGTVRRIVCQVINASPGLSEPDGEDGGRARLSKRAVVDRALKLADTEGLDA